MPVSRKRTLTRLRLLLPVLLGSVLCCALPAHAATNFATGGIGGHNDGSLANGDGTGDARIELNSVRLALVKQARDTDGQVLAPGADVVPGQQIYFVLLVDNTTDFPADSLRLSDALNEAEFSYIADSLETTAVPSGADAASLWSAAWTPLTDAVNGASGTADDEASVTDTAAPAGGDRVTVGETSGQINQPLVIPARTLRAVRFRVTVN